MGMSGIFKSQVSRLWEEIDVGVKAFLDRPIEGNWPYLWIDATYIKVRRNGRIVSVSVIVAVGANADGRREVLGMQVGPSEAETFWTDFLRGLARRRLRGVKLVISDAHPSPRTSSTSLLSPVLHRGLQPIPSGSRAEGREASPLCVAPPSPASQATKLGLRIVYWRLRRSRGALRFNRRLGALECVALGRTG